MTPTAGTIKLVQLNIWQGRLLNEIVKFINQEKPDLLCLQEVYSRNDPPPPMYDFYQSYQIIRSLFPDSQHADYDRYGFFSPHFGLKGQFEYGNAVLSKIPFTKPPESKFTNGRFVSYETLDNFKNNQLCMQKVQVEIGGQVIDLFNHHGYWDRNPMGKPESLSGMEVVASEIDKSSAHKILTGDLNVKPESPALGPLNEMPLINLTRANNLPSTLSQYGKAEGVACDYILVSEGIKVINFGIGRNRVPVSDHEPLVLEFTV